MKKIIFLIIGLIFITSCQKQEVILDKTINNNQEKYFAVIPHHNLVNKKIDEFYSYLNKKHNYFDNIVIISPNHFTNQYFSPIEKGNYCDNSGKNCVKIKTFKNLGFKETSYSFKKDGENFKTIEHGLSNHFGFINKYFSDAEVFNILLKINTKEDKKTSFLTKYLNEYNFGGKTLFVASVDFSHHVNEKVAVFHDMKTIDFLNNKNNSDIEVDCPNCLYLIRGLANKNDKYFFNLYNRTSVDTFLSINSNYDNTSHIYGEFEKIEKKDFSSFNGDYFVSEFEESFTGKLNQNSIDGMFFGDTHFTRGFTYNSNEYRIEDYLSCFYSNNDLSKKPQFWHNRMLYSFDYVGVNLETSIGNKGECQNSSKEIVFQTNPKYLDSFKDIGINLYNLANNHSYDCGKIGYDATKKHLEEKELLYFGDGRKDERVFLKEEKYGTKIAFVGFNDIGNQINLDNKSNLISDLTNDGYIVIVNIHWGYEYALRSNKRQQNIAKNFIDNGAKLIVGHHPHVVQENDIYKGVPIFYSLGNFIFDQPFENTLKGYGLIYSINGNGIKYNLLEFDRNSKTYKINCDDFT